MLSPLKVAIAALVLLATSATTATAQDTDGDTLSDGDEVHLHGSDPLNTDTDADGLDDGSEVNLYGTDPLNPDTDGDGLTDYVEIIFRTTDPLNPDTDNDGLSDYDELNTYGTDPLNSDTDGDGLSDGDEFYFYATDPNNSDTDCDGFSDGEEVNTWGTDPTTFDADDDLDGVPNAVDICLLGPDDFDEDPPAAIYNPRAAWRLNEILAASTLDQIGLNDATVTGPTLIDSPQGNALEFDGIADFAEIPNSPDFSFDTNDTFTVMCWVRIPPTQATASTAYQIIEKWSGVSAYPFVIRLAGSGIVYGARYDGTNAPQAIATTPINDNQWHHIAFVRDNTDTLHIYIDSVLENSTPDTTTATTQNTSSLFFGKRGNNKGYLTGALDEVAIFGSALAQPDIQDLYTIGLGNGTPDACDLPPCPADTNGDGFLDNGDITAYINLFLAGDPAADFNGDTFLDNGDINAFIAAFLAGC